MSEELEDKKGLITLDAKSRLFLPDILPKEGNRKTMELCRSIKKKTRYAQEEYEANHISSLPDGRIYIQEHEYNSWDYDFTKMEISLITESLIKLHNEKKLNDNILDLAIIFGVE